MWQISASSPVSDRQCAALQWFIDHTGIEVPWPQPLADGTFLATRAKGIYKPSWTQYALSIRQTLGGPYPDRGWFSERENIVR